MRRHAATATAAHGQRTGTSNWIYSCSTRTTAVDAQSVRSLFSSPLFSRHHVHVLNYTIIIIKYSIFFNYNYILFSLIIIIYYVLEL